MGTGRVKRYKAKWRYEPAGHLHGILKWWYEPAGHLHGTYSFSHLRYEMSREWSCVPSVLHHSLISIAARRRSIKAMCIHVV